MNKLTVLHSGVKAAKSPRSCPTRGKRTNCSGWSAGSARRCDLFLRSIVYQDIEKAGYYVASVTLTVADCPPTHTHWASLRDAFLKRMRRGDLAMYHWVTEWQLRSWSAEGPCPHLHCVLVFPSKQSLSYNKGQADEVFGCDAIVMHWLEVAEQYNCNFNAQHAEPVYDIRGWFRYLSKHAARSVAHYQRDPDTIPKGWSQTGRMWGQGGDWPRYEVTCQISDKAFYTLRRVANRYLLSDAKNQVRNLEARLDGSWGSQQKQENERLLKLARSRVGFLKRRLQRNKENVARIVPLSEWVPVDVVMQWLRAVCIDLEAVDPESGEVSEFFVMEDEYDPQALSSQLREAVQQKGKIDDTFREHTRDVRARLATKLRRDRDDFAGPGDKPTREPGDDTDSLD